MCIQNEYYPKLIDTYQTADFTLLREKASDMISKAESADLKSALNNIITKIDVLKNVVVPAEGDSIVPVK